LCEVDISTSRFFVKALTSELSRSIWGVSIEGFEKVEVVSTTRRSRAPLAVNNFLGFVVPKLIVVLSVLEGCGYSSGGTADNSEGRSSGEGGSTCKEGSESNDFGKLYNET